MRLKYTLPLLALIALGVLPSTALADGGRLGMHSILYPETPYSAKEKMFSEAKQAGASMMRVDISLASIYIESQYQGQTINIKEWSRSDQFKELSERYKMPLLVVLYGTPERLADCPQGSSEPMLCPPSDPERYRQMIEEIVGRYKGVAKHWEIINEPDKPAYFAGTPARYTKMLEKAHQAIRKADPEASLVLGGISDIETTQWMDQIMEAGAAQWIDIPSIHLRSSANGTGRHTEFWRRYFDQHGISGPMWITEFGYPSDPAKQWDRNYAGGEESQAQFYRQTMPWMLSAGATRIFVTERDWGSGTFASEGILEASDPLPENPSVRRRLSFQVFKDYAENLEAKHPPAPRGSITVSSRQGKQIKIRHGSAYLKFSCPQDGYCPAQSFRLRLQGGGSYLIRNPDGIKARSEAAVKIKLTKLTRRRLAKSGKGIPCELYNLKQLSLGKFTLG